MDTVLGALAGAAAGACVSALGLVIGLVFGAMVGVLMAFAMAEQEHEDAMEDRRSDFELGVVGGDLGAPGFEHPPATVGTYSAASAGSAGFTHTHEAPDEGPIPQSG